MANGDKPPGWKKGDPVPQHPPTPTPTPQKPDDDKQDEQQPA